MIIIPKGVVFAALLIHAANTDIKRYEIDDWVCVAILIVSLYGSGGSFWGAVLTALLFYIPAIIKDDCIGGGDVKLMFACGAVLGVWGGLLQTIIALSLVVVFSLIILILKGFTACKKITIPLAPFLCVGGIVAFVLIYM